MPPIRRFFGSEIARLACQALCLATCAGAAGLACADDAPATANGPVATSLAALHSDLKFNLVVSPRKPGEAAADPLFDQARRVVAGLQAAGVALYPDAMRRIGTFDVFVADSTEVSALSSASGRIALNAGFADLKPTDDWLAFVLAREMGHVIAGHHSNNSAASIATSVLMNLLIPGSGIIKSALSFAGSQLASESGRERQVLEADEIAIKLLEAAGYAPKSLALNLTLGPKEDQLGRTSWAQTFGNSAKALIARVRGPAPAQNLADAKAALRPEARPATSADVPPTVTSVATSAAHLGGTGSTATTRTTMPEELLVRTTRPSGLPGPLLLGGYVVPARRIE